jgi:hypothetical protein
MGENIAWLDIEGEGAVVDSFGVLYSIPHHLHLLILALSVLILILSARDQKV